MRVWVYKVVVVQSGKGGCAWDGRGLVQWWYRRGLVQWWYKLRGMRGRCGVDRLGCVDHLFILFRSVPAVVSTTTVSQWFPCGFPVVSQWFHSGFTVETH